MTLPAMADAARDVALRGKGAALQVYLLAIHDLLDLQEWRPIKQEYVATRLELAQTTVSEALLLLVNEGYLRRVEVPEIGYQYRLVYSRASIIT